jgi:hypothetical protein
MTEAEWLNCEDPGFLAAIKSPRWRHLDAHRLASNRSVCSTKKIGVLESALSSSD